MLFNSHLACSEKFSEVFSSYSITKNFGERVLNNRARLLLSRSELGGLQHYQNYLHGVDQNKNFKDLENWPAFHAERDTARSHKLNIVTMTITKVMVPSSGTKQKNKHRDFPHLPGGLRGAAPAKFGDLWPGKKYRLQIGHEFL